MYCLEIIDNIYINILWCMPKIVTKFELRILGWKNSQFRSKTMKIVHILLNHLTFKYPCCDVLVYIQIISYLKPKPFLYRNRYHLFDDNVLAPTCTNNIYYSLSWQLMLKKAFHSVLYSNMSHDFHQWP